MKISSMSFMSTLVLFNMAILLLHCSLLWRGKEKCHPTSIKTIFTDVSTKGGEDRRFAHYVLVEGFDKSCKLDSSEILSIVNQYIDTVFILTKPVGVVNIFTSMDRFIPSETSQDWNDVNKDCLVSIMLDVKTREPIRFKFYDQDGKVENVGSRWRQHE